jgi:hypothetical protein
VNLPAPSGAGLFNGLKIGDLNPLVKIFPGQNRDLAKSL